MDLFLALMRNLFYVRNFIVQFRDLFGLEPEIMGVCFISVIFFIRLVTSVNISLRKEMEAGKLLSDFFFLSKRKKKE
jgi:hypothetical protein